MRIRAAFPGASGVTLLVAAALFAAGCGGDGRTRVFDDKLVVRLAELPGAKASKDPELTSAIAQLEEQRGAPWQLAEASAPIPDADNVAAGLAEMFSAAEVVELTQKADALYPADAFKFDKIRLEKMIRFRQQNQKQLAAIDQALGRPACRFGIDFRRGFFGDMQFVDVVWLGARLEAFQAAELIDEGRASEAMVPLRAMFRLAQLLAAESHVQARLSAGSIRSEAIRVMERIAQLDSASPNELTAMLNIINQQLAAWPPDAAAWIGDRALTVHAYEAIRLGYANFLITPREMELFKAEGILRDLGSATQRVVNEDERFYLAAMDRLIAACDHPFHERLAVFSGIREDLHALNNTDEFPIAAARLFLPEIENGMRRQADDRANCEAAAIALSLAAALPRPPYETHPVTGKPYIVREDQNIQIWTGEYYLAIPRK